MLDVLDIHTHTTASGHAYNTIYEMAQSASRKGLALLGISDHGPAMEGSASKHYFRSSRCIPRELYGVKILFGCELNIMDYDGGVDLDEVFAGALDYGIASLHDVCITPGSRRGKHPRLSQGDGKPEGAYHRPSGRRHVCGRF